MDPILLITLLAAFLIYMKWRWDSSVVGKASKVVVNWPGPPRTFLFGNTLEFKAGSALVKQFVNAVDGWYPKYGSPMRISMGPVQGVHIFRADHAEAILKDLKNTRKSMEYDFVADWLGKGLLISYGEKWFTLRKLLTPTFHFAILKDFMGTFNKQTKTLMRVLKAKGKGEFDICPAITHAALDVICETAMGSTMNAQEETNSPYVTAIQDFAEIGNFRTMRPWLWPDFVYYYLLPHYGRKWTNVLKILHDFTNGVIQRRIQERTEETKVEVKSEDEFGGPKKRTAFLDLILDMKDEGKLTLADVTEEVDTFMFEGHDTTAHGIMWAIYSFGRNPEAQQKAREEINDVMGDNEELSVDDLGKMKYFEMCLKESQRIWPSVPMIIRNLDQPLLLDEKYTVPTGTSVYLNIFTLHHDPKYFPDPLKFDPERFSPENAKDRHPFAYVPFSAGLRNCIGQKFALMEMKVVLANLLRHFEIRCEQKETEMEPSFMLILRPENGVTVALTPLR